MTLADPFVPVIRAKQSRKFKQHSPQSMTKAALVIELEETYELLRGAFLHLEYAGLGNQQEIRDWVLQHPPKD